MARPDAIGSNATNCVEEEAKLLAHCSELAQAINLLRNSAHLKPLHGLRSSEEFSKVCRAWERFRDDYGDYLAVHYKVRSARGL